MESCRKQRQGRAKERMMLPHQHLSPAPPRPTHTRASQRSTASWNSGLFNNPFCCFFNFSILTILSKQSIHASCLSGLSHCEMVPADGLPLLDQAHVGWCLPLDVVCRPRVYLWLLARLQETCESWFMEWP